MHCCTSLSLSFAAILEALLIEALLVALCYNPSLFLTHTTRSDFVRAPSIVVRSLRGFVAPLTYGQSSLFVVVHSS